MKSRPVRKFDPARLRWLGGILAVAAGGLLAWGAANLVPRLPGVQVKTVQVQGELRMVSRGALEAAARRGVQGNLLTLDVAQARRQFEQVPWVRSASVRKLWPGTLVVTLEEHVPLARWGTSALVNTLGERFRASYEGFLPVFVGPSGTEGEMAQQYREFVSRLAPSGRVPVQILLSARGAWQVKLDNGLTLALGRAETDRRLARFVWAAQRLPGLEDRRSGYVDLRYPNGFALKLTEGGQEPQGKKAKRK